MASDLTEDEEVLRILKNRVIALAFLENDDDSRYRRFSSSQISNHFLAEETVSQVATGEIPKYVRRNILVSTLEKACRTRSFWIPISGDDVGSRFAKSPTWPAVMVFLEQCGKGRRVIRGVGGRQKYFFRISNRREVLALLWGSAGDPKVRSFHNAMDQAIKQL